MFTPGPVTLTVGDKTTAEVLGFDQNGAPMTLPAGTVVTFTVDNPALAASTPNADELTDAIVALAPGVANLTATIGSLTDTEVVTVLAAAPVLSSIKIAFGS